MKYEIGMINLSVFNSVEFQVADDFCTTTGVDEGKFSMPI